MSLKYAPTLKPGQMLICQSASNPAVISWHWVLVTSTGNITWSNDETATVPNTHSGRFNLVCEVKNFMGKDGEIEGTDHVIVEVDIITPGMFKLH